MSGDILKPEGDKDFEAKVRDLGLGELKVAPVIKEYDAKRIAKDESDKAAALDAAMNANIEYDAHVQERQGKRATKQRIEKERKKTLRDRMIMAGTAVALFFGIGAGVKAMDSRRPAEKDREIPNRESIIKGNERGDFVDDASGTNAAVRANFENGENVDGLDAVTVDKTKDPNAELENSLKIMEEKRKEAEKKGEYFDDGLDTSKLE